MIEVQAPEYLKQKPEIYYMTRVFLAGSIEMGKAINWQSMLLRNLADVDNMAIYNPRRNDWDSSWVQSRYNVPNHLDGIGTCR